MKKITLFFTLNFALLGAFEFGYMGNTSFGMGGSGVGVANSAWGLYYNPAMQGVDNTFKVGYSLGARYSERGVSDLLSLKNITNDLKNLANNIDKLNSILNNNGVDVALENGITLQAPLQVGSRFSQSIAVGVFYTKRTAFNATGNINTSTTDIDSANNAFIVTNQLDIIEVPISYTVQVYSGFGTFYAGAALKYFYAGHSASKEKLSSSTNIANPLHFGSSNGAKTHGVGIDVGLAYSAPNEYFVLGIVGKNLNSPTIKTQSIEILSDKLKLDAQYRVGISTRAIPMTTLAADFDLKPNYEFSGYNTTSKRKKVQYVSFGALVELGFLDLKAGLAKNIADKGSEGWIVSAGLGFGYLDFSFFSSTKMSNIKLGSVKLPSEFGVKLGGGFSF